MGLEDRDALRVLQAALDPQAGSDELIRRLYNRWFALDAQVRDLFPPELDHQRAAFGQAMHWVFGEFVAQRAQSPVAFLAQLGRDHRKYGVTQQHYDSMRRAWYAEMRSHLIDEWTADVDDAAVQAINLITGIMSGAADAEDGPAWWEGSVLEHHRVSRDLAVVRLHLDRPMPYHPGQYVNVQIPQWPRRWRYLSPAMPADPEGFIEFHVRCVLGGMVSNSMVAETRPGDRWRLSSPHGAMEVDRTGGDVLMVAGSTGLAPLRAIIMDLCHFADNPRVHLFFGARYPCELYDLQNAVGDRGHQPLAVGVTGVGVRRRPAVGRRLPRRPAAPRTARSPDRPAAGGRHQVRRVGRPADPDLRRTRDGARHPRRVDRQGRATGAHPARPARRVEDRDHEFR